MVKTYDLGSVVGPQGTSAYWFVGTAVTTTGTGISAAVTDSKAADMYLNSSTYNVYIATAADTWDYVCNIKGITGETGATGETGKAGTDGDSAYWFTGTAVTTTGTGISAEVAGSGANDMYLNTSTYNVYIATAADTWDYVCNIKGATGAAGAAGADGVDGTDGTSAFWFTGTAVTTTGTGISAAVTDSKAGDMYLNTETYNIYAATAADTWDYKCNVKGAVGETGATGAVGADGADGTSAYWFTGTAVTGTGTDISAAVTDSKAGDMYLNTSTINVYKATAADTWDYVCNLADIDYLNTLYLKHEVFTTGGSANAYTVTTGRSLAAYFEGLTLQIKIHADSSSTTPTIDVDGIGAKTIYRYGTNNLISASFFKTGSVWQIVYDGTNFVVQNYPYYAYNSSVAAVASSVDISGQTAETTLADDDLFTFYDTSASASRKVTGANTYKYISGAKVFRLTDNKTLALTDCGYIFLPNASSNYTITIPKDVLVAGFNFGIVIDNTYDILVDPAADVTLNGGTDTLTFGDARDTAFLVMTAVNACEAMGDI